VISSYRNLIDIITRSESKVGNLFFLSVLKPALGFIIEVVPYEREIQVSTMPQSADNHEMAMSHLQMIEHSYCLTLSNKEEICRWITKATTSPREILTVALALNTWIAVNNQGGELSIPREIVNRIISHTVGRW